MSLSVASYNTRATAYIQLVQYRRMPAMVLSSDWRILVAAARVANLARGIFFAFRKWNDKTLAVLRSRLATLNSTRAREAANSMAA